MTKRRSITIKGKSARRGNASSPYAKYGKTPYRYSAAYQKWKRDVLDGRYNIPEPIPKLEADQ